MTIGTNIKKLREQKCISQVELADYLNISQSVISSWESDITSPNANHIPKLSEILGVEVALLFEEHIPPTPNPHSSILNQPSQSEAENPLLQELVNTLKDLKLFLKRRFSDE